MHESLLDQGLSLLVYGMGTVFVFLALLVLITKAMSVFIGKFLPEAPEPTRRPAQPVRGAITQVTPESHVLKVIAAAVAEHRAKRRER